MIRCAVVDFANKTIVLALDVLIKATAVVRMAHVFPFAPLRDVASGNVVCEAIACKIPALIAYVCQGKGNATRP